MWVRCITCRRPLIIDANIKSLRLAVLTSGLFGSVIGAFALPFLGFGLGGITAGSFAASVQGPAVAAGSMFAVLQSLGATGLGILLFGSIGAAIGVITPIASDLGWCYPMNHDVFDIPVEVDKD